jgi:hypothetical protein
MLTLGNNFDRNYSMRIPMMDKNYDLSIFFNTKTSFMLFRVDPELDKMQNQTGMKIQMFKNLESSKFCEKYINLHDFKKNTLDIRNQFESVKPELRHEIMFLMNESITLSKTEVGDKTFYDTLTVYGMTLTELQNEFFFLIAERQNIIRHLNKKMVRTIGIQLATSTSLEHLNTSDSLNNFESEIIVE